MDLSPFIQELSQGNMWLLILGLALCSALLEDIVMVIAGVLAAEGTIPLPAALAAGYLGALIADTTLYAVGMLARTHVRLAHYVEHGINASFRTWFMKRYPHLVFVAHFVPGLRVTTYIASGLFRLPFLTFLPRALASGILMCTFLFTLSYTLGSSKWLGPLRYALAAFILVALFFFGRAQYRALKREQAEIAKLAGDTAAGDGHIPHEI